MLERFEDCQFDWELDEDEESELLTHPRSVPSYYKKYTVEERRIVLQKPIREKVVAGVSYNGQEEARKVDLAQPNEESKLVYVSIDLSKEEEKELAKLLEEFRDVFT